jgi:dTDP-4-amino-4,6-dideoxygalactose transaminase
LAEAPILEPRVRLVEPAREYRAHEDDLRAACERVLARMQLLGGDELGASEREMATYLRVEHVRGVASGTDALTLAARAAGVQPGYEVPIQANVFVAAIEALIAVGACPVPIDVRLDDLGPDPDDMASRITPRTRAIRVVHLYGLPVDLEPIVALARERHLILLEDCSHAHGARYDGRRVGGFGAASAFSLGVVKNLAAYGDAGIVATNDATLADTVQLLGTHGQARKNEHVVYGTNSRLDEIQAGMLRVNLRRLDVRTARRAAIASYYSERCMGARCRRRATRPVRTSTINMCCARSVARPSAYLGSLDIETGIHYPQRNSPAPRLARHVRRAAGPAARGAGGPSDPLAAGARRPDRRRGRARGRRGKEVLRLMETSSEGGRSRRRCSCHRRWI